MRRKSERTASKKTKASPEKKDKPDKVKKPKTRRRKESTSSGNESAEETTPVQPPPPENVPENNPPQSSTKEDSPEETNDQVWQVKTAEGGDVGDIQKLKICLTRPPSTPERADRSPRSKRKHSRSASGEPTEERKKTKHRTKRSAAETKDDSDKNPDSQGDEPESEKDQETKDSDSQGTQKQEVTSDNTPMSTTTDEAKTSEETKDNDKESSATEESTNQEKQSDENKSESQDKPLDADTTVSSPKTETEDSQNSLPEEKSSRKRSVSGDKSEILEIHADESRLETSDIGTTESRESPTPLKEDRNESDLDKSDLDKSEVSNVTGDKTEIINTEDASDTGDKEVTTNKPNVVECSKSPEKEIVSSISKELEKQPEGSKNDTVGQPPPEPEPTLASQEGIVHNGQATHSSRKRRWGSRPNRISTQKSITISTDVLKDIIPDVTPVEFDEVIEEKKHNRRVEVTEKLERPVLPKIVIDNTESVEINKKESDDKDKENVKVRETNLSSNRKISIVKDNDSVIARPPSPPQHKQSNVLYITNLVRPFTLPQLKNLLQRTGRIVDNGFWIDRIKSKCYVQYENEDQAVETRHALHGVTWPVSNPKTLHVDFSTKEDFNRAKANEETDNAQTSTIPGTVEDWLREQDLKRERGELEKPWERKMAMREWDVGKNEKGKEKEKPPRDDRFQEKRRHRTPERSPEPAKKFKKKEEEAPAKLLDDLFRKTKATPCIYWLPLSAETIAIKEEQRRQHMAEHERRLQELRRTRHRH